MEIFMKKLTAIFILISSLFLLVGCGDGYYEPKESSALESQVVMTIAFEDKTYSVRYELYRALFLDMKSSFDNGDDSVWSGDKKDEYIAKIDAKIKAKIADIYSVIHTASKIGIDVYSDEFDTAVKEYVKISVDGGYYDDVLVEGFDGDYDAYLESLKADYLNYSVQDLLLRYSIAFEKINEYYMGYVDGEFLEGFVPGKLEYTRDDVLEFYNDSTRSARVIRAFLRKEIFSKEQAELIRNEIIKKAAFGTDEVASYIIGLSPTAGSEVANGEIIGRHSLDAAYYSELEDAAFSLGYFEVSEVISISTGDLEGYTIIYKTNKSSEHFDACYDYIASVYVTDEIGKILDTAAEGMLSAMQNTPFLNSLDRSTVTMQ